MPAQHWSRRWLLDANTTCWGTFKLTDEDLREPPELLRETWKHENRPDDALEIPAIDKTLLLEQTGAR